MSDSEDEKEPTLAEDIVVTKYKMASEIVTSTLSFVIEKCVPGAKVIDLCEAGDNRINDEIMKVFKKEKEMKKGIAFPTCICVNHIICYYSPLKSETEGIVLKDGDLVKINLGAHIDGFPVIGGHTIVIGASRENKVQGRKADVILAAHHAAEACLRLIKVDNDSVNVADFVSKVASDFNCKPVEGIQCHSMKRNEFHDKKSIVLTTNEEVRKTAEKFKFEKYEVWNVNVVVSSGDGRPKESGARATVFCKNDLVYQLKLKSSRQLFNEVSTRFGSFPFTLRAISDEKNAKIGVVECRKHDLFEVMNVYQERENEFVAAFQFTILLMPNGPMRIGALPFDSTLYQSQFKIVKQEIKELINGTSISKKKKKKKTGGANANKENVVGVGDSTTVATTA